MPLFSELYQLFVFDLDGTLADTRADLTGSLNHAFRKEGLPPLSLETVTRFVGNGARVLIEKALGAVGEAKRVEPILAEFLLHYGRHCLEATCLYPGVLEALRALRARGSKLAVLTNKPLEPSRKILAGLGLAGLLERVAGGDSVPQKKPHPAGLLAVMSELGAEPGRTLFVGDSEVDAATARAARTPVALVTYGFQPQARQLAEPDYALESLIELLGGAPRASRPPAEKNADFCS